MSTSKVLGFSLGVAVLAAACFVVMELVYRQDQAPAPSGLPPPTDSAIPLPNHQSEAPTELHDAAFSINQPLEKNSSFASRAISRLGKHQRSAGPAVHDRLPKLAVVAPTNAGKAHLEILSPQEQSYVMVPTVAIRARSQSGASVKVNNRPLAETAPGMFSGTVDLKHGPNLLKVQAVLAEGNTSENLLRVTYVPPQRVRHFKKRFDALLREFQNIQSATADVDHRIQQLLAEIETTPEAEPSSPMVLELEKIHQERANLQKEIETVDREIQDLLAKNR